MVRNLFVGVILGFLAFTVPAAAEQWVSVARADGKAYFAFESPARVEVVDLTTGIWQSTISFIEAPTAITADDTYLYVAFGRRVSRFNLDGTGEAHLQNTFDDIDSLLVNGDVLYIHYGQENIVAATTSNGTQIEDAQLNDRITGLSIAPGINKIFASKFGGSPRDIYQLPLEQDGSMGNLMDSPYHGDFPGSSGTFVFPAEDRVIDTAGRAYSTADLTVLGTIAGPVDDLDFHGDGVIALRDTTLYAHSADLLETGRYSLATSPAKIYVEADTVYAFFVTTDTRGVDYVTIQTTSFGPAAVAALADPAGAAYMPDFVALGDDEIVYLFEPLSKNIFRYSTVNTDYLTSIPLAEAPDFMVHHGEANALKLGYQRGRVTAIDLSKQGTEQSHLNTLNEIRGMEPFGDNLFTAVRRGSGSTNYYIYDADGQLVDYARNREYSTEYIWSVTNDRMYYLRDNVSPNDISYSVIDDMGIIGEQMDSPYHGDFNFVHPLRVSPDGSIVLLGNGLIFDAITLDQISALSNDIVDAVWANGTLYTLRDDAKGGETFQLQKWTGQNYALADIATVDGIPIRLFELHGNLLVIGVDTEETYFKLFDSDLEEFVFTEEPPDPSDLDENGVVDAVDVQLVINYVLGVATGDGDVNDDESTDAVDVQIVINTVLGV